MSMRLRNRYTCAASLVLLLLVVAVTRSVSAHPDDEFCRDGGMDPMLCDALAAIDNPDAPVPATAGSLAARGAWATFGQYAWIGIRHIIPGGTDHLLFLAGLVLGLTRPRALVWLVTAFTLAHGIALAAAVSGWISAPSRWVEAGIAATIAWVGIENLLVRVSLSWRYTMVLVFGLVHGLGFAGFIQALGLPSTGLVPALVGFNLGVEIGQLIVVAGGALVVWLALQVVPTAYRPPTLQWLRRLGSLAIAVIGSLWVVTRLTA